MTTSVTPEHTNAFRILQDVVQSLFNGRGRCVAASLKPVLKGRGGFDEKSLGFQTFGDFLRAAQQAGYVSVIQRPGASDLEVLPPGVDASAALRTVSPPVPPRKRNERRIRADLWEAFVNWNPSLRRVYNLKQNRAIVFPELPSPLDSPDTKEVRADLAAHPEGYAEIKPITDQQHIAWMRQFAASQEQDARTALENALSTARPAADFTRVIHATPALKTPWSKTRLAHVEERIREWIAKNGLVIDPYEEARVPPPVAEAAAREVGGGEYLDIVRGKIRAAIDRMPLTELLKLQLPIEYLIDAPPTPRR